jgi:aminopeptidase S
MAGGHLDSVAAGPGINDNASGVAALLAIAERRRGERGLRFGFWTAEELGLYGSERYVDSLGRGERRRIAGYLNLDMVASPNPEPEVYGRGWVRPRLDAAVRSVGLTPVPTAIGDLSDHAPFARAGIDVGGLHTGAFERAPNGRAHDPCYHERCDDLSNVDWPILRQLTAAADRFMRGGAPLRRSGAR